MGIGKKVVTGKAKKTVENATANIPGVGDFVDKNVHSGPMDRAGDGLEKTKDKLERDDKNRDRKEGFRDRD
jgi:hypothetical protein